MAQTHALLPQSNLLVIFGGDGDLSWRKLLPAVYNLNVDGVLPSHFAVSFRRPDLLITFTGLMLSNR